MRSKRYHQRGMGLLGWIVVLAIASFFLTCLLKIGPLYMDYWTLQKVLDDVAANSVAGQSKNDIRASIQRRLDTNRVDFFKVGEIRFEETREALIMDAGFERRVPLMGNIDVVVKFDQLRYPLKR